MKMKFYKPCVRNPALGWLKIGHKSEKKHNFVKIYRHDVIVNFFDVVSILFLILGTGFSIMTGSAVMTVFV